MLGGEARALQVPVGQGSGPGIVHRRRLRPPGMSRFHFMEHGRVPAARRAGTERLAGAGEPRRRRESSVPPSVFTVFKVLQEQSTRLSGG